MSTQAEIKHAVLDVTGGTCTSCVIAIEHLGRRVQGIHDIVVDRGTGTIQIEYDGNREALEKICDFVTRIGYSAEIRTTD